MSVMAPLTVRDMGEFEGNLKEARQIGVEAVTVDVWWGRVMERRDDPQWGYYLSLFKSIREAGLAIVPIIAFHRCGGGPGDNCNIPMPAWIYSDLAAEAGLEADDLRYESETGRKCSDYLAPWVTSLEPVKGAMRAFMEAFANHEEFKRLAEEGVIKEINVSMGPTGELRYPAYNGADGWEFPHRGLFQAYSRPARASFREWAMASGGDWVNEHRTRPFAIRPPFGHVESDFTHQTDICGRARADQFVGRKIHAREEYGRDFIRWYHESLLDHCRGLLGEANAVFGGVFASIPLGMKIPGIHWQWRSTDVPRYAELTAGLMPYQSGLRSWVAPHSENTGYDSLFQCVADMKSSLGREIVVHFTALEMDDDTGWKETSMAHTLVMSVGETARRYGVTLSGENALKKVATDGDDRTWYYIDKAFDSGYFSGFTLLRLCEEYWNTDKEKLESFIKEHDLD